MPWLLLSRHYPYSYKVLKKHSEQFLQGHALIIPKEHYANLYELDDELAAKALVLAKKMITKLTDILGCDLRQITTNYG